MRTKSTFRNVITTFGGQFLTIIITLFSRKIFLSNLGSELLGLNSLFINILSFLSMAELGIGNAINYSLYKPLAENDITKIKSIMNFYKLAYYMIGIIIFICGIILCPFIPFIVNTDINLNSINLIYFLFVFKTSISYFFSYKAALIIADQQNYIFTINHHIWKLILNFIQIVLVIKFKNYYLYLIIDVIITILENFSIAKIANRKYPFLTSKKSQPLDLNTKLSIKKNTISMVLNRIGSTIINSTDNILISAFINLSIVGLYGNYTTITIGVNNVLYQVIYSVSSSIGNLVVEGNLKRNREVFFDMYFVVVWIYGWVCAAEFILLTPFIKIWYGSGTELSIIIVLLLVVQTYFRGQSVLMSAHIQALGIYEKIKYNGIIEAIINLVVSILLGKVWGIYGILLGSIIAYITSNFWLSSKAILTYGYKIKRRKYYLILLRDSFIVLIMCISLYFFITKVLYIITDNFFIKLLLCIIYPNLFFLLCFHKRKEFKEVIKMLKYLKK